MLLFATQSLADEEFFLSESTFFCHPKSKLIFSTNLSILTVVKSTASAQWRSLKQKLFI
jgi:hypothetical protein